MPLRPISRPKFLLALVTLMLAAACGGAESPSETPVDELPPYTAAEAALYNDSLAPEIFGVESLGKPPTAKETFADLVGKADSVARARLTTVTRTKTPIDGRVRYVLVVEPMGETIVGEPLSPNLELTVGLGSPSLSLLHSMDAEMVGSKFILFVKRYRAHGESVLHFRAEVDSASLADAVRKLR
ncbi:MAG TPA: hypothetical protein VHM70_13760 [Polyangiaceae bacterium]|nr:hypothetical protein [Polyangiaceae bacterium]